MNIQSINNFNNMSQTRKTNFGWGASKFQPEIDKLVKNLVPEVEEAAKKKAEEARKISQQYAAQISKQQYEASQAVQKFLNIQG